MRQCTRCRAWKSLHALTRIYGGDHSRVYYCPPCWARWWAAEERAAISLARHQHAPLSAYDVAPCGDCGRPTRRPRRGRCGACYVRLLRAAGKVAS